jgi:hypothetical protein
LSILIDVAVHGLKIRIGWSSLHCFIVFLGSRRRVERCDVVSPVEICLAASSRTDGAGWLGNRVALFADNSVYAGLVSPGEHVGIHIRVSSILAMLVGAGEGIMDPHASQSELLCIIHRCFRQSFLLVLHFIVVEGI